MKRPLTSPSPESRRITDGLLRCNPAFLGGMSTIPLVACTNSLRKAILLSLAFDCITVLTFLLSFLVPKRVPYAIRILSYSILAALVYLPVGMAADSFASFASIGMYLPLLTVCTLLHHQPERYVVPNRFLFSCGSVGSALFGFDVVALLMGILRELFSLIARNADFVGTNNLSPTASTPFLGMILLGCFCAFGRLLQARLKQEKGR